MRGAVLLVLLCACEKPSSDRPDFERFTNVAAPPGASEETDATQPTDGDAEAVGFNDAEPVEAGDVFADDDDASTPVRLALSSAAPATPGRSCTNVDFSLDVPNDTVARAAINEVATCEQNDGESGSCADAHHIQCGYGPAEKYLGGCSHRQWCTAFVSWVYDKAGEPFEHGPFSCGQTWVHTCGSYSCNGGHVDGTLQGWFRDEKTWARFRSTSAWTPAPGDYVRYQWKNGNGHSGVVLRVDGDTLYTVEGNVHDGGLDCPGVSEQGVAVCRVTSWRSYVAEDGKSGIYGFGLRRGTGRELVYSKAPRLNGLELTAASASQTARSVQVVFSCAAPPSRVHIEREWGFGIFVEEIDRAVNAPPSCNGTFSKRYYLGRDDGTGPYGRRTSASRVRVSVTGSSLALRDARVLD